jgi:glutamine cyclotransferase
MKKTLIQFIAAAAFLAVGCKNKTSNNETSNNGTSTNATGFTLTPRDEYTSSDGKPLETKLSYPASYNPDSIVYFLDSVRVGVKKDSSAININTDTVHMGQRTIWAKIYKDGTSRKITTTFYMAPAQMPEKLSYSVINKFPHDTSANTEGLSYQDGFLYETTGDTIHSEIRKVDLATGKVVQRQKLGLKNYGKGNTVIGDKVIVFLSKQKFGLLFDKNTLKPLGKFDRTVGVGGWGVTTDGSKLYFDDGGSHIWLLSKDNYQERGVLNIFDHEAPVEQINELEYVEGKIYANVYGYDTLIGIDAKTGAIMQAINMTNIWPYKDRPKKFDNETNVLNGIAYDTKGKRLFVTGKKWAYVYQIEITKGLPIFISRPNGK